MRIRDARAGDAPGLAPLLAELGYPEDVERVAARADAFDLHAGSFLLVAEDGEELTGLASATVHSAAPRARFVVPPVRARRRERPPPRDRPRSWPRPSVALRRLAVATPEVTTGERAGREAAHALYESLRNQQVSRRYLKAL